MEPCLTPGFMLKLCPNSPLYSVFALMPSCNLWIAVTTLLGTPHFFSKRTTKCPWLQNRKPFSSQRTIRTPPNPLPSLNENIQEFCVLQVNRNRIHVLVWIRLVFRAQVGPTDLVGFCWGGSRGPWKQCWEERYRANCSNHCGPLSSCIEVSKWNPTMTQRLHRLSKVSVQ